MNSWDFVGSYYSPYSEESTVPNHGVAYSYMHWWSFSSSCGSTGAALSTVGLQVGWGGSAPQGFIPGSRRMEQLPLMAVLLMPMTAARRAKPMTSGFHGQAHNGKERKASVVKQKSKWSQPLHFPPPTSEAQRGETPQSLASSLVWPLDSPERMTSRRRNNERGHSLSPESNCWEGSHVINSVITRLFLRQGALAIFSSA